MSQTLDRFPGEDFDELLEVDPDETNTFYTPTFNLNGLVTQESWVDSSTALELKRIEYTYGTDEFVTVEVRKVYDPTDGTTVVSQKTITYSYSNGIVTGAAVVRDV